MFNDGDLIDERYEVEGTCSDSGGMGLLLFVRDTRDTPPYRLVLKYCRGDDAEFHTRFRREVRLLGSFEGNSKVAQLWDSNLEHTPPYYVMRYYEMGDLFANAKDLRTDFEKLESAILQMLDCIQELHSRSEYHRDIKPQNFLVAESGIVVSDLGLSTELGSKTAFTRSSIHWGTPGYIPPEFLAGGFKYADATGDIYMLGKSIYALITDRDPMYLQEDGVPPPLFHVIERCCLVDRTRRYQSIAELKQSVVAAFDVLIERGDGIGAVFQRLTAIAEKLQENNKFSASEIHQFIEALALLTTTEKVRICRELPERWFDVLKQESVVGSLEKFLAIYELLVDGKDYGWSYAEIIADKMRTLVRGVDVPSKQKARALELAVRAAIHMNRFAAMDTCRSLIVQIQDAELGMAVAAWIPSYEGTFVSNIEPIECRSPHVRRALQHISNDD